MFHSYQKTVSLLIVGGLFALSISCCAGILMGGAPLLPTKTTMTQPCYEATTHAEIPLQASACVQALAGIHGHSSAQLALLFTLIILSVPLLWWHFWRHGAILYCHRRQKMRRLTEGITVLPLYRSLLAQGILHPKIF